MMMVVHFKGIANSLSPDLTVNDLWQEGHTYEIKVLSDLI